jgi:LysR family glycine cleavage system transcriptional activator
MADYLPLTALKAFEATARHGSFKKAANELHVTTGAVSQQIKTLEDILGVKLFHRLHRGLEMTEAARSGLPKLTSGFADIADAMQHIRNYDAQDGLSVWVAPSFASKWLVPKLNHFIQRYPQIDLRLSVSNAMIGRGHGGEMVPAKSFYQQDIDVGIFFGRGGFKDYRADKLFSVDLVPLSSPKLVNEGEYPLRQPQDLIHHNLLHDDTAYEGRPDWAGWLRKAGVEGINAHHGPRFNQISLALDAAVNNQGVVLGIRQIAQADIASGKLVIPFEPSIKLNYSYYIVSLNDTADEPNISAFREWVLAEASLSG